MNLDEAIKRATTQQEAEQEEEDSKAREAILDVLRRGVDPAAFEAIQKELRPTEDHFGLKHQGWYYVIELEDGEYISDDTRGPQVACIYRPGWFFQPIQIAHCTLENGHDLLLYLGRQEPKPE